MLYAMVLTIVLAAGLMAPAGAAESEPELETEAPGEVDPAAGCDFTAEVQGSKLLKYKYEKEVENTKEQFKYKKQEWKWKSSTPQHKRTEERVGNTDYGSWSWALVGGQHVITGWKDAGEPAWGSYQPGVVFKVGSTWYRYRAQPWATQTVPDGTFTTETMWSFDGSVGEPWVLVKTVVANHKPNRVRVLVNGSIVDQAWFGNSWSKDYTLEHGDRYRVLVKLHGSHKWQIVEKGRAHCPPQPDDKVEFGEWEDGTWLCDDTEVTITRTVTTIPFVWNPDEGLGAWVPDWDAATTEEETDTRPLTPEEFFACPDQPEDDVVFGEWEDGDWECDDTEVTITRSVTTTPYVWDDEAQEWVEDTDNATTEVESDTRTLTEDEFEACVEVSPDTEASEPQVEEPEDQVEVVAVQRTVATQVLAETLPRTGASVLALMISGLLALFAGGSVLRRRRS